MSQKRITFRVSDVNVAKLEELADRYGMSVNSLVGFIVGQWLDSHYDMKDRVLEKLVKESLDEQKIARLVDNPMFNEIVKEVIESMAKVEVQKESQSFG